MEGWGCTGLVRIWEKSCNQVKQCSNYLNLQVKTSKCTQCTVSMDHCFHTGVSGRTQCAVCLHLTSIVSANALIDSHTTGYHIFHTQSRWKKEMKKEQEPLDQTGSDWAPQSAQSESVSLEHVDSKSLEPTEKFKISVVSLSDVCIIVILEWTNID